MARVLAAALLVAAAPLAAATAVAPTTLTYVSFFSGVGSYWNSTTASEFETALQAQYASVDPSSVSVTPVDFPIGLGVTLLGVQMNAFNSVPHLQDRVQDAIGQDASVNGTSQVQLGAFTQSHSGLYMPFTIDNLGGNAATARDIISSVYTTNELVSTSSALSTTLATAGIQCSLAWAPPTNFPAGQPDAPSTGVMLQISIGLANASMASEAVAVNMFDTGLLLQELNANGVSLGVLYGAAVLQTHTITVTAPGGAVVSLSPPVPGYDDVFLAPPSQGKSAAPARAAVAAIALAAAALAVLAA